jgi:hypothetical protein
MAIKVQGTTVIDDSRTLENYKLATQTISSNTTAESGSFYVATAEITLTLPSSPNVGDIVGFQNSSDTEACVIARNGNNILSLAEDMTVDALHVAVNLQYSGSSAGWVFV